MSSRSHHASSRQQNIPPSSGTTIYNTGSKALEADFPSPSPRLARTDGQRKPLAPIGRPPGLPSPVSVSLPLPEAEPVWPAIPQYTGIQPSHMKHGHLLPLDTSFEDEMMQDVIHSSSDFEPESPVRRKGDPTPRPLLSSPLVPIRRKSEPSISIIQRIVAGSTTKSQDPSTVDVKKVHGNIVKMFPSLPYALV